MSRRIGAGLSVLALLSGFSAAPYTHAHHAMAPGDAEHSRAQSLVHTHATPHSHSDSDEPSDSDGSSDDRSWSIGSFLFQQSAPAPAAGPAVLISARLDVEMPAVWIGRSRLQPVAHGPPATMPAPLRAPPSCLPAIA